MVFQALPLRFPLLVIYSRSHSSDLWGAALAGVQAFSPLRRPPLHTVGLLTLLSTLRD